MKLFARMVRSTLTWLQPEQGEDWGHRLAWTATTIVSFPVVLLACSVLVLGASIIPGFNFEAYGAKRVFGALWVLIWVASFFPADRITARHLAGSEPFESGRLIVLSIASTLGVFLLAALLALRQ